MEKGLNNKRLYLLLCSEFFYLVKTKRLFSVVTFRQQRETYWWLYYHSITNLHLNCLKHNECTRSREHSQLSRGDVDLLSKMHLKFSLPPPIPICFSVSRSEAESWRMATQARCLSDIWPLTGCADDPRGQSSTMGGTCLFGLITMVTQDLFGEVARGVSGSKLSLYPDQCNVCCMWTGEDITLTPHKSVI